MGLSCSSNAFIKRRSSSELVTNNIEIIKEGIEFFRLTNCPLPSKQNSLKEKCIAYTKIAKDAKKNQSNSKIILVRTIGYANWHFFTSKENKAKIQQYRLICLILGCIGEKKSPLGCGSNFDLSQADFIKFNPEKFNVEDFFKIVNGFLENTTLQPKEYSKIEIIETIVTNCMKLEKKLSNLSPCTELNLTPLFMHKQLFTSEVRQIINEHSSTENQREFEHDVTKKTDELKDLYKKMLECIEKLNEISDESKISEIQNTIDFLTNQERSFTRSNDDHIYLYAKKLNILHLQAQQKTRDVIASGCSRSSSVDVRLIALKVSIRESLWSSFRKENKNPMPSFIKSLKDKVLKFGLDKISDSLEGINIRVDKIEKVINWIEFKDITFVPSLQDLDQIALKTKIKSICSEEGDPKSRLFKLPSRKDPFPDKYFKLTEIINELILFEKSICDEMKKTLDIFKNNESAELRNEQPKELMMKKLVNTNQKNNNMWEKIIKQIKEPAPFSVQKVVAFIQFGIANIFGSIEERVSSVVKTKIPGSANLMIK